MLREFQRLRNDEGKRLEIKKMQENERQLKYKKDLVDQIQEKKQKVYESREEYMKDKQMVEQIVNKIIEEEEE